ncbi:hypothetical protein ACMGDH_14200 [Sphingomonas sp. DT-207]|uniref:hypothetical protein n=1 Tax=Sphingomonas sp. DT-207 TaxID=3396167 RepID=UPI003F1AC04B
MTRPNLKDPAERAAYQRELAGVARRLRLSGLFIALAGAVLVVLARRALLPLPLWGAAIVLGLGMMLMITAIATRSRYHRLRMAEED